MSTRTNKPVMARMYVAVSDVELRSPSGVREAIKAKGIIPPYATHDKIQHLLSVGLIRAVDVPTSNKKDH